MSRDEDYDEYDDDRLEGEPISCKALIFQTSGMPDAGMDMDGQISFLDLGIESDERFDLDDSPIHIKIHLAAAKQDIIATGSVEADVQAICDRCAEFAPLHLADSDIFHTYKNALGQPVDLTESIREDILLTFPQSFHCSEDCKGLCPRCGQNLNLGQCTCSDSGDDEDFQEGNPWKVLDSLNLK